jgi:hypothetical protein
MAKLQELPFRNVAISYIDVRRKAESAPFLRLHMTADLTPALRNRMDWSIGNGQKSGDFVGTVQAVKMIIGPQQKKLPGMEVAEIEVEVSEVSTFSFTEKKDKDGNTKLLCYYADILSSESAMKVTYSAIGKTSEVPDEDKGGAADEGAKD